MTEDWVRMAAVVGPPAEPETARRDRAARVAWSCLVEPGDRVAGALIRAHGAAEGWALAEAEPSARELGVLAGIESSEARAALDRWRPRRCTDIMADAVRRAARNAIAVVTPDDPFWPPALEDLGDHAPPCLWVRGDLARLRPQGASVAIVGARAATSYGEHVAAELAAGLAQAGIAVVSGAAYGIDGVAHRAALAAGGETLAFLAGGCDRPYPSGHADLIERIAVRGVVVSEVPCGAAPTKWRFLQRNRLIAAVSDATVVVEAGLRSGSLNTAGHAAALGRPIGAVPGPVTSAASAGTHRLLREYDAACVTNVAEVRELVGAGSPGERREHDTATPERTRVLDALSERAPRTSVQVAERCGMAVTDVEAELGGLMLEGAVEPTGEGWRRRRR